jgi:uncharacterized membrane protein YvlD (DUF360 family)
MKYLLRLFIFNVFALWFVSELYGGLVISGGIGQILVAGFVLTLLMYIVKPILKILFIPINFITFGVGNWFINVAIFLLLTFILPEVIIREYLFPGLSWQGFMIPSINFSYIWSLVIVSIAITITTHIIHGVSEG